MSKSVVFPEVLPVLDDPRPPRVSSCRSWPGGCIIKWEVKANNKPNNIYIMNKLIIIKREVKLDLKSKNSQN